MRIVQLVIGGGVAGGQLLAARFASAARVRGDDVSFVSPADGPFLRQLRSDGYQTALVDVGRTYRLDGVAALARHLRSERADVFHTHTLAAANALSRIAARVAGVPIVSHLHIENHFRPATRPLLRALDNRTARLAARLVAVSQATRAAYERQGYPRGRIELLYNGVEPATSVPSGLRAELGLGDDGLVVALVGRLCDVKGQRELIEALGSAPGVRAILVGDDLEQGGEYRRFLEREAERLGVTDRVVFAGPRDDVDRVLADVDVLALPSWTEGLPLVALEAMARGRPVIATPVGGTAEAVVDGETGILVPPRDPQRLAEGLRRLAADPALRERLGAKGRERVAERFSAREMTRRMLEIYDEVAGSAR
jgi:glycosyltransferase involved in cell wall biosynthesis